MTFLERQKQDLTFGYQQEDLLLETFRQKFDRDLEKTKKGATFDYESKNLLLELKSRHCKSTTYKSTMVGYNKIEKARIMNKRTIFAFNYVDGIYYWEFNEDEFASDLVQVNLGGRCDRGRNEVKEYCYIDMSLLKKL